MTKTKKIPTLLILSLVVMLPSCDDLEINFFQDKCKDTERTTDQYLADPGSLDDHSFDWAVQDDMASFSMIKNFSSVCPADSIMIEFQATWDSGCPKPVYFELHVNYNGDLLSGIRLKWSEQGNLSVISGTESMIAPRRSTSTEFSYVLVIRFDQEADSNLDLAFFKQYFGSVDIRFTYSRNP